MGGNLFKLGRLPQAEYKILEQKICQYLDQKLGDNYRIPRYYNDKPDFGDIDIVISTAAIQGDWQQLKTEIIDDLQLTTYKSVGAVFSTVYENFQVDYFIRKEKYFLSTYNFLSFNDIGNLIGRIFRKFNLKYGEKGLMYVFRRADNHYVRDIPISIDFEKIFNFLELDYLKWQVGFANKQELFDWVIDSPYFSVRPYLKDNQSKSIGKRVNVRPTIQAFLAYLEEQKITKVCEFYERDAYLPMINAYFPEANLLAEIAHEKQREAYVNAIREKYNGRLIMEWIPELNGKQLGLFINTFQESLVDYEKTLFESTPESIRTRVLDFYSSWKTT